MEIRPSDLIQLKKDIERIRKHEDTRSARNIGEKASEAAAVEPAASENPKPHVPVSLRIREMIEGLLSPPSPSKESLEAIPEYLITLLQVIREEPKFRNWLLQMEGMPPSYRNQLLERMSHAFRIEDSNSEIAAAFDQLHDAALFKAVCQYLGNEDRGPQSGAA